MRRDRIALVAPGAGAPTDRAAALHDRAVGALVGHAVGDALGVPYEFVPRGAGEPERPRMLGGGLGDYEPGEWSDDTQLSLCVARAAAAARVAGARPLEGENLDEVAAAFLDWEQWGPPDIGIQTRAALRGAQGPTALELAESARRYAAGKVRADGNGALMRTEPVALAHLHDREAAARAARAVAALTHAGPLTASACVVATEAVRVAVLTGTLDFYAGLDLLPVSSREYWRVALDQAHTRPAAEFSPNGFVVTALQAAIASVVRTPVPAGATAPRHLVDALATAVRIGGDTDTVAAIAGAFLGATWGASAVPWALRRQVHGWAGSPASSEGARLRERDLADLAATLVTGQVPATTLTSYGEPASAAVRHPRDRGVWLGTSNCEPPDVDAVVSLCRVGVDEPTFAHMAAGDRVEVRLIDSDEPGDNPNLAFVLADAAVAVATLRREGRTVLVHCVAAQQRTPSVAVAYSRLLGAGAVDAEREVREALRASVRGHGHVWEAALAPELDAALAAVVDLSR